MEIFLIICAIICMFIGIAGCIVPILPGATLCYIGILILKWGTAANFSQEFLIGWGIVIITLQILDILIPIWGTKKFGGGKLGSIGCMIGTVVGIFLPPWGIILGPFIGALCGEIIDNKPFNEAFRAGFGSFLGFITGTFIKLIVAAVLTFFFIKEIIAII